jgi:hypothetical protein
LLIPNKELDLKNIDINENQKSNFSSNSTNEEICKNLYKDLSNSTLNVEKNYKEGFLYKITTSNKLKKIFFKLIGKDFYCN